MDTLDGMVAIPEVTVVIPTRDRWSLLDATLASVLRQQEVGVEVVIVDDGSSDPAPTRPRTLGDPRVRVLRNERSGGVAAARNRGIAAARAEWVAFLDDDDLWAPDKLRRQLAAARGLSSFVYSGAMLVDVRGRILGYSPAPSTEKVLRTLTAFCAIPAGASNVIAPTATLRELGGFDEQLVHLADWDMWARLAKRLTPTPCDGPLVAYVQHVRNMRAGLGPDLTDDLAHFDAKHLDGRDPGPERMHLWRWIADGHRLAGQRRAALRLEARTIRRYGCPHGFVRAYGRMATTAMGGRTPTRLQVLRKRQTARPRWLDEAFAATAPGRHPGPLLACANVLLALLRLSDARVGLAVVYHGVGDGPGSVLATHGAGLFARQVAYLADRFAAVPASGLVVAMEERRRGRRFPVAITFDDDLRCHLERAAPVLHAHRLPATFFLTGASLTGPHAFWWQRLERALQLDADVSPPAGVPAGLEAPALIDAVGRLSPAELDAWCDSSLARFANSPSDGGLRAADVGALLAHGLEIGFHTRRHHPLTKLDDAALASAMRDGRAELEAATGRPLTVIAYPHGKADARVARAAGAAGFHSAFTTQGVPAVAGGDRLLMGRLEPSHASLDRFAVVLVRALARAAFAGAPARLARS